MTESFCAAHTHGTCLEVGIKRNKVLSHNRFHCCWRLFRRLVATALPAAVRTATWPPRSHRPTASTRPHRAMIILPYGNHMLCLNLCGFDRHLFYFLHLKYYDFLLHCGHPNYQRRIFILSHRCDHKDLTMVLRKDKKTK